MNVGDMVQVDSYGSIYHMKIGTVEIADIGVCLVRFEKPTGRYVLNPRNATQWVSNQYLKILHEVPSIEKDTRIYEHLGVVK